MRSVYRKVAVLATVCALGSGVWPAVARPLSAYREYDSGVFAGGGFKLSLPGKGREDVSREKSSGRAGEEAIPPELLPLSVSSFRTVGNPIMPKRVAEAVAGLDKEERRQLEASLMLLLRQYEQQLDRDDDFRLKNNLAGSFNFLFGAAYSVLKEGRALSPEQRESMLRQLNAGFALRLKEQRLSDREKQELYESAVLSGSIILGLYTEGRDTRQPALQRTARELARELLTRLMGLSIEQVRTEGDSVRIN
ncbi:hypothetical protein D187_003586 [Cystobacter fuscus DSM 2262]|uniref:Uncharacterized protein n=1 Tax=Cystobacter fuscus (strain ATCC 25194 / DSM 2262 / NBRC 100088 / M29) TaxID=1242864 RepID=S9P6R2_CYSF2|nr:DUF6683 family protein [Cystobacter fuscus]EPX58871.1 hypothetical protein D187_003586 [Cystobacter fuscus DSM 2262]